MKKNPTRSLIIFCACLAFCILCAVGINTFTKMAKTNKSPSKSVELEQVAEYPVYTITIIDTGETIYKHTAPIQIIELDRKNKFIEFIDYGDILGDKAPQKIQWNEYCVVFVTRGEGAFVGGVR